MLKHLIKAYWYVTGYIRKHGWKFLLAIVAGGVIFSIIVPRLMRRFSHRRSYYIGVVGEYNLDSLPLVVRQQLSRSLVMSDSDGSFVPDLADKMSIEKIDNSFRRYRFTLPEGIYWQDGKPLEATDINYRTKDANVTYDGLEIVYELPEVFASFPQMLTAPLLRFERVKKWGMMDEIKVYGLSDVHLTSYKYLDDSHYALSQVVLDDVRSRERFVYRFYYTQAQAIDAFKLGEVDYLFDVTNVEEIKNWEMTEVTERLVPDQYLAVFFNTSDPLMTRNMRQALSYAVEKERPGYQRAVGPISEDSWAYFAEAKKYDKNIASGVERLLDEMPGEPIELSLITTSSFYDVASRIKEDWEELGEAAVEACQEDKEIKEKSACEYLRIKVQIQIQTIPDTNNFQTMLVGQQVALDPDQYSLWHSDLATNFTHYKNTRVDNLLEKADKQLILRNV